MYCSSESSRVLIGIVPVEDENDGVVDRFIRFPNYDGYVCSPPRVSLPFRDPNARPSSGVPRGRLGYNCPGDTFPLSYFSKRLVFINPSAKHARPAPYVSG